MKNSNPAQTKQQRFEDEIGGISEINGEVSQAFCGP